MNDKNTQIEYVFGKIDFITIVIGSVFLIYSLISLLNGTITQNQFLFHLILSLNLIFSYFLESGVQIFAILIMGAYIVLFRYSYNIHLLDDPIKLIVANFTQINTNPWLLISLPIIIGLYLSALAYHDYKILLSIAPISLLYSILSSVFSVIAYSNLHPELITHHSDFIGIFTQFFITQISCFHFLAIIISGCSYGIHRTSIPTRQGGVS